MIFICSLVNEDANQCIFQICSFKFTLTLNFSYSAVYALEGKAETRTDFFIE